MLEFWYKVMGGRRKIPLDSVVVAHTFTPSTQEAKGGGSL